MKKKLTILLGFTLCAVALFFALTAESGVSDESPEGQVEQFFSVYKADSDKALIQLFNSNKNITIENMPDSEIASKLREAAERTGKFNGYDLVVKRNAGESVVVLSYMAKHDVQPLFFTFVFYKPKSNWQILNFEFNSDVDQVLKSAAEAYLLEETYLKKPAN